VEQGGTGVPAGVAGGREGRAGVELTARSRDAYQSIRSGPASVALVHSAAFDPSIPPCRASARPLRGTTRRHHVAGACQARGDRGFQSPLACSAFSPADLPDHAGRSRIMRAACRPDARGGLLPAAKAGPARRKAALTADGRPAVDTPGALARGRSLSWLTPWG
jgi:hypothetical protein